MLRVYEKYEADERVFLLSHTIDPATDTVPVLKEFSEGLGVSGGKWHFVTGEKRTIHEHAKQSYMTAVGEDDASPGGLLHAGYFLLVDRKRRIRGVYDGTDKAEVSRLLSEMDRLLEEKE